jgi:hypothetical protein
MVVPGQSAARVDLVPPDSGGEFGIDVAVDGDTVAVLALGTEVVDINGVAVPRQRWRAHVFDVASGTLLRTIRDPATAVDQDTSASTIFADDGLLALIAAGPDLLVFDTASAELRRKTRLPPTFTGILGLDGGRLLLVSSSGGVSQVRLEEAVTAQLIATYDNPMPEQGASTGFGLHGDVDGDRVVIGNECGRTGCAGTARARGGRVCVRRRDRPAPLHALQPDRRSSSRSHGAHRHGS